jgi:hypothetical protein
VTRWGRQIFRMILPMRSDDPAAVKVIHPPL